MTIRLSDSDNQSLHDWRANRLGEADNNAFEERLFFEPGLVAAAQQDDALAAGLKQAANRPARMRPRIRQTIGLLAAAGLGAMAMLPFALTPSDPGHISANIDWVSISARRSTASEPMLVAPRAGAELVAFEVAAPQRDGTLVSILVQRADGKTVMQADRLKVLDGAVTFAFARGALAEGVHSIEVSGPGGEESRQALRIRYQPD